MSRSTRPTKTKGKARRTASHKSGKNEASRYRQLEKRLAEADARQAATSEILRVIAASPNDLQPVFDMIAERAMRLCGGRHAGVMRFDGELIHLVSHAYVNPEFADALRRTTRCGLAGARRAPAPSSLGPSSTSPTSRRTSSTALAQPCERPASGAVLAVPMLRDGEALGAIVVLGTRATPFSEQQIDLLQTFADQAVIAIENVRLFKELQARNRDLTESLEQQTATSEILRVISSSPTDLQPVFDIIARERGPPVRRPKWRTVTRFDGEWVHLGAIYRLERRRESMPCGTRSPCARAARAARRAPFVTARSSTSRTSWPTRNTGSRTRR